MTVTITRAQRDALYEEMLTDLTAVGDIYLALNNGDGARARRLWRRFEPELRLLEQLGWNPVEPLERFTIDLPHEVLVRALGVLQDRAEHAVGEHLDEPAESLQIAQRALQALGACRGALSQLADAQAGERS
jgi:hypothetical protein